MNTLKLKFKLTDNKEKTISIKNVKQDLNQDDVKALANYIVTNAMIIYGTVKVASFIEAIVENTKQTKIQA